VGFQVLGGLEHFQALGGQLQVAVELLVQLAQRRWMAKHLVGAAPGALALGEPGDFVPRPLTTATYSRSLEVQGLDARGQVLAQDLGQLGVKLAQLAVDQHLELAVVVGLQGQGMARRCCRA
jgi:hypothetical protein